MFDIAINNITSFKKMGYDGLMKTGVNLTIIDNNLESALTEIKDNSLDVAVISTHFNPRDKFDRTRYDNIALNEESNKIIEQCVRSVKVGGFIFVYGIPATLPFWADRITNTAYDKRPIFKYWIALDIDSSERENGFAPSHQGLLMFLIGESGCKNQPTFFLNTKNVRIPHQYCKACNQNVKDWGGKKHLMNPKGTCISDVWNDIEKIKITDNIIPASVLDRVIALTTNPQKNVVLHVIQKRSCFEKKVARFDYSLNNYPSTNWVHTTSIKLNHIYEGDSISLMKRINELHPEGLFDLAFADPPYNLNKKYEKYEDGLADQEYIEWCNKWLYGMYSVLKPGGAMFVLNLPKWALHHSIFLNHFMEFRAWIVWNALSEPRGKIMPAHYALLYYTKPGGVPKFNYSPLNKPEIKGKVLPPVSLKYCLRAKCIKTRKLAGYDERCELTDVWSDLHRIKHKRDRDSHPCQLPDSLMERIILLTTDEQDIVFDPFGGTGTTAIVAHKLNRKFVICDIDAKYVEISRSKISKMEKNKDLFGILELPKQSIKKDHTPSSTKKEVEIYLQQLAARLNKVPSINDVEKDNPEIINKIDSLYPDRNSAIKRSKIALQHTL